jgi:peptide/nickel transport system ATP-binding protein
VIEVRDLHVTFAGHVGLIAGLTGKKGFEAKAVDGISFELRRGEVLALAGESGCGKTTTARTIMGLQEANAGEIVFEGKLIGKKLQAYRRRVQMVFQDPTGSLNPRQTIRTVLDTPRFLLPAQWMLALLAVDDLRRIAPRWR